MEKQFNSLNEAVFSVFFSYYFLKGKHKMDEISKSEYFMKYINKGSHNILATNKCLTNGYNT
jgi:hypothetical protein